VIVAPVEVVPADHGTFTQDDGMAAHFEQRPTGRRVTGPPARADWIVGVSNQTFTGITGLTGSRDCTDNTDLPGTNVRAYQFDNPSDYQTSFNAYKQVVGFTSLVQGCPPPSNDENGTRAWFTQDYPQQSTQFVDCGLIQFGNNQNSPTYVWTIPSHQTFVRAVASPSTSFADLNTWFNDHALP
jgi:hypothetical protein